MFFRFHEGHTQMEFVSPSLKFCYYPTSFSSSCQQKSRPFSGRLRGFYVQPTSEAEPFWAIIGQTNTIERPFAHRGSCEPMLFC